MGDVWEYMMEVSSSPFQWNFLSLIYQNFFSHIIRCSVGEVEGREWHCPSCSLRKQFEQFKETLNSSSLVLVEFNKNIVSATSNLNTLTLTLQELIKNSAETRAAANLMPTLSNTLNSCQFSAPQFNEILNNLSLTLDELNKKILATPKDFNSSQSCMPVEVSILCRTTYRSVVCLLKSSTYNDSSIAQKAK